MLQDCIDYVELEILDLTGDMDLAEIAGQCIDAHLHVIASLLDVPIEALQSTYPELYPDA